MYHSIPNGSSVNVQGLTCQLPPIGYGKNRRTGEVEYIGVANKELPKAEQKWKRLKLPGNYVKLVALEKQKQEKLKKEDSESDWTDNSLDKIREEHWIYRLCGYWFMNNGIPTYITGTHWFYLNWCSSNTESGYMDYRSVDRELFYAVSYTDESPYDGGIVFVGRRQCGKTFMANAWLIDRISINNKKHGAIQSKTEKDALKVFTKLVNYFFDLPEFFRPTYDQSQGLRPKDTLRFFETNIKGKNAEKLLQGKELRSYIDFGTNKSEHYDGDEAMYAYILDEFGKKQLSDVRVTWETVRPCIDKEGRWFGKAFICSTIEDLEDVGDSPRYLFYGSDTTKRNANNRTETGLVSIFFGAQYTTYFDEYGDSVVGKAVEFHTNERASIKDSRALSSYKRKNPFTITEAFRIEGDKCLYDSEKLNDQLDVLSCGVNYTTRGNFVWKEGKRDTHVVFEKDRNGRWEVCWLFPKPEDSNKMDKLGNKFKPLNNLKFVIGCDPFSHNVVKDDRRSDGAAVVLMKFGAFNDSGYNNAFVCKYKARPPSVTIFYEDMIKMAVYYGCKILFESNNPGWRQYFIQRGYEGFLMKLPDYPDYGIPANEKTKQHLAEVTEDYILNNSQKVWFADLLTDWLEFDLQKSTKYDLAMAAGWAIVADTEMNFRQVKETSHKLTDFFHRYKNTA